MATVDLELQTSIDASFKALKEMEKQYDENSLAIASLINQSEELQRQCEEELNKLKILTNAQQQKLLFDHEKAMSRMRAEEKELMELEAELMEREASVLEQEAVNRSKREDIEQQNEKITQNENALAEQKEASKELIKLAEDNMSVVEKLQAQVTELEMKRVELNSLKVEARRLNIYVQIQTSKGAGQGEELKKLFELDHKLKEASEELVHMEEMNQTLTDKERICHEEVEDAHEEIIQGLEKNPSRSGLIGTKTRGDIDSKVWVRAANRKVSGRLAANHAARELGLKWANEVRDPRWHPFKVKTVRGQVEEELDYEDEKLKLLKNEYGDEAHDAVATALEELKEYRSCGSRQILWNFEMSRRATLEEGVTHLINELKKSSLL